jgi:drug/metabolite transporter (DMT)-like permease
MPYRPTLTSDQPMPEAKPIPASTAYLLMSLTALFWAGNFVIGRAAAGTIPPLTLAWARWAGAAALILPFAAYRLWLDRRAIWDNRGFLFFLGCLGAGLFNTLQYLSLTMITAVTGAVINSAGPVLIAIACWAILGERLRVLQIAGIVLSLAGVLAVVGRGDLAGLPPLGQSLGEILMLVGLVAWGVYTALLRFRPPIHPLSFAAATYLVAALANTPLMLWELSDRAPLELTTPVLAAFAYVAVFPSLLAYLFFNLAVESVGGARASAFFHLTPLMTAALALTFLGETFAPYHVVGFALILAGIWLTARGA